MPTGNEAWSEANAACPPSVLTYITLEVNHPSFAQPARIVANVADDMTLGGQLHVACPFEAAYPEQREGQPPSTKVKIDNVNRELVPKIRAALGTRAYIKVLYREYLSSDLTAPAYGPVEFLLKDVAMVGTSLTGSATVAMLTNKRFPRQDQNYDYLRFPSLLPG